MIKTLAGLVAAGVALGPATASAGQGGFSAGGAVHLLPLGSLEFEAGTISDREDTALAYGLGGQLDYWVTDQISVGFAPRYILNVTPADAADDDEAATQLDLALRAAYSHAFDPRTSAFGCVSVGYSRVMLPEEIPFDDPAGMVIGFGGGVRRIVTEQTFVQGELGYQLGFQEISEDGQTATFASSYLHLGVGIGSHF